MIDWLNNLTGETKILLDSVIVIAAAVGVIIAGWKTRWAVAAMVTAGLVGAGAIWLVVFNGLLTLAGMLNGDVNASGVVSTVTLIIAV